VLTAAQWAQWLTARRFEVVGSAGGRYRVERGVLGNIVALAPDGRPTHRLCVHPDEGLPLADMLVAQTLALQSDEPGVLRLANRHALRAEDRAA
jgi:hypothetical protein